MPKGLALTNLVKVDVNISPLAIGYRNFGGMLIVGSSDVIDTGERIRQFSNLDQVADEFELSSAEYLAARLFFSQSPQPSLCYIGRWAQAATKGRLNGTALLPAEQLLSNFTAITTGSFKLSIDGDENEITGLNFSAVTNLNGVASLVQTKLQVEWPSATCVWDANYDRFIIRSGTTGALSTVSLATNAATGVAVKGILKIDAGRIIDGMAAETPEAAVVALADMSTRWYGLAFATATPPTDEQYIEVASFVEASGHSRIFAITMMDPTVLDAVDDSDLASQLKVLGLKRTFIQYSSTEPYAAISAFGRAFTVNFEGNLTTLTLKFKQQPGVVAESITESQGAALAAKHCNVFVNYDNESAILQEGVMTNGYFFDEVHGLDWLQNVVQTSIFNVLYQSPKIPQTDAGTHRIVTVIEHALIRAVNNGLAAPGKWTGPDIGALLNGDVLTKGFYVYAPLVASQPQEDREQRKSVPIQVALKLAGAIHSVNVILTVNR